MSVDDTTPTDADDVDLDPDGAPCLVCGQTVPGPGPALLCPDCTADTTTDTGTTGTTDTGTTDTGTTDTGTTDTGTTATGTTATGTTATGGTAELLPALWPGSTAQIHGPGTGKYTDAIVRVVSYRGHRWTVETSDGTRLKIDPIALRTTDQRFLSSAPVYVPGSVVTVTPPIAPHPAGQRFVVTGVRVASLTVAKLGGDPDGATYRVPPIACRPADPDAGTPTR